MNRGGQMNSANYGLRKSARVIKVTRRMHYARTNKLAESRHSAFLFLRIN